MVWKVILLFVFSYHLVLTTSIPRIDNALFDPVNSSYRLNTLFGINSLSLCICQCYTYTNCNMANYYGINQTCFLLSAGLAQGNLPLVPTSENATVIVFKNTSSVDPTCVPSTSFLMAYTTTPSSYQQQTFSYTASYIGFATLEFGFKATNSNFAWHLDDVSVIDTNIFNFQQLTNIGFEYGNLIGWQLACSSTNCGGTYSGLVQTSCHTGSYCYKGACPGAYDYLRQSFFVVTGHVYTLSFWIYTDGNSAQAAYVNIS